MGRCWGGIVGGGAFVFVAVAACARTDLILHGKVDAQAASAAAVKACKTSAQALCARAAECSPLYVRFFFETVTECEALVTDTCAGRYEGPRASSAPRDCVAEARAAPCELVTDPAASIFFSEPAAALLRACPVTPGSLGDHAACLRDGDCASGSCAEFPASAPPYHGCWGCTPQRRLGEACDVASTRVRARAGAASLCSAKARRASTTLAPRATSGAGSFARTTTRATR